MSHAECSRRFAEIYREIGEMVEQAMRYRPANGGSASKYKGVSWSRKQGKWVAYICRGRNRERFRSVWLGAFESEEEAALAFDRAARERWGTDCYLNFPEETP